MKVPVVNRRDYTMYLELYSNMLWFHTDIFKWTLEVKKEYLKDLDALQNLVTVPLVALVEETDKKLAKFGESTGWSKFNKLTLNDTKYDVYTRSR
jgi:RNAse (barnase) inhibitor barstar